MTRAARPIGAGWWLVDGTVFGADARRSLAELESEHGPLVVGPQTHAAYDEHGQDRTVEEPVAEAEMAVVLGCSEAEVRERFAALAPWQRPAVAEHARARRADPRWAPGEPPRRSVLAELQIAIERSGLALDALAERAGVPAEAVRELLHGYADPSLTTAARLLLAIGGRLRLEPSPMTARAPRAGQDAPATILDEVRAALAGLSQRDLHTATGIAQSSISRVLSGAADPHVSTVDQLLAAAGYRLVVGGRPLAEILDGATDPPLYAVVRIVETLGQPVRIEKIRDGT